MMSVPPDETLFIRKAKAMEWISCSVDQVEGGVWI